VPLNSWRFWLLVVAFCPSLPLLLLLLLLSWCMPQRRPLHPCRHLASVRPHGAEFMEAMAVTSEESELSEGEDIINVNARQRFNKLQLESRALILGLAPDAQLQREFEDELFGKGVEERQRIIAATEAARAAEVAAAVAAQRERARAAAEAAAAEKRRERDAQRKKREDRRAYRRHVRERQEAARREAAAKAAAMHVETALPPGSVHPSPHNVRVMTAPVAPMDSDGAWICCACRRYQCFCRCWCRMCVIIK
jgi:hypothetical protein